jgi:serine protease Do
MIQPVTKELAESFGLKEPKGALISQVLPGSPAEKAGLKQGDIIVEFNGKEIDTFHDLPKVVNVQPVGSKAKVKFIRDGKSDTTTVILGEQRERGEVEAKEPGGKASEAPKLGLKIQDITPEIAEGLGLTRKEGVVVTEVAPSSPAQSAGLKRGDVILEANRKMVKSAADFAALVGKADRTKPLLLLVQRGGSTIYLPLKWQAE